MHDYDPSIVIFHKVVLNCKLQGLATLVDPWDDIAADGGGRVGLVHNIPVVAATCRDWQSAVQNSVEYASLKLA